MRGWWMAAAALALMTAPAAANFGRPAVAGSERVIEVKIGEYSITPDRIGVRAGETVTFIVTNAGKSEHGFVLGDAAFIEAHAKMMESAGQHAGHGDGGAMHGAQGNVLTVKPGETQRLNWTFAGAGELKIVCDRPGHAALGMSAVVVVK